MPPGRPRRRLNGPAYSGPPTPFPDGLIGDGDTPAGQQVLHVSETQTSLDRFIGFRWFGCRKRRLGVGRVRADGVGVREVDDAVAIAQHADTRADGRNVRGLEWQSDGQTSGRGQFDGHSPMPSL